jgi:Fur family peroxide stress response transcriptional regulator
MRRASEEHASGMRLSAHEIAERFRATGRKVTPQRAAIFEVLSGRGGHPTVDSIYRDVRKRFPMISLNTVYQTVEALVNLRIVSRVSHAFEAARYETDLSPHHHAVCVSCKRITDVFDAALGRLQLPRSVKDRFRVVSHRVEFLGYCDDCHTGKSSARRRAGHGRRSADRAARPAV